MEKQISSFSINEIIIKIKEDCITFIEMQNTISKILNNKNNCTTPVHLWV